MKSRSSLIIMTKASSIIFSVFTSVQRVLFTYPLPPTQKSTMKMSIAYLMIGIGCSYCICRLWKNIDCLCTKFGYRSIPRVIVTTFNIPNEHLIYEFILIMAPYWYEHQYFWKAYRWYYTLSLWCILWTLGEMLKIMGDPYNLCVYQLRKGL